MIDFRTRIDGSATLSVDVETENPAFGLSSPLYLDSVDVRNDFGFTLGASRGLVQCLSACADLVTAYSLSITTHTLYAKLDLMTHKLLKYMLGPSSLTHNHSLERRPSLQALHDNIFACGLLIVVNRIILNP